MSTHTNIYKNISFRHALGFVWWGIYGRLLNNTLPPLRIVLLRLAGAHVGGESVLFNIRFANVYHHGFSRLIVGNHCFIGDDVTLDVRGGIELGDHVTLSNRCSIISHINVGFPTHPLQRLYPSKEAKVIIKRGAYIGTGAIILPGITIGEESVVAAGAVVTRSVPKKTLVAGVPARVKKRF